jgi:hypothetical protein
LNPQPLAHETSVLTTRPWLLANPSLLCHNHLTFKTFSSNQKLKVSVSNPFTAFTIPTFNSKAQVEEEDHHHHHHHHHHLSLQTIPKKLETFCIKNCS